MIHHSQAWGLLMVWGSGSAGCELWEVCRECRHPATNLGDPDRLPPSHPAASLNKALRCWSLDNCCNYWLIYCYKIVVMKKPWTTTRLHKLFAWFELFPFFFFLVLKNVLSIWLIQNMLIVNFYHALVHRKIIWLYPKLFLKNQRHNFKYVHVSSKSTLGVRG